MSPISLPPEIARLSVAQRILLAEQIWDSVAAEEEVIPPTPNQQEELDRRLRAHEASPGDVVSWDDIKNEHRGKK